MQGIAVVTSGQCGKNVGDIAATEAMELRVSFVADDFVSTPGVHARCCQIAFLAAPA